MLLLSWVRQNRSFGYVVQYSRRETGEGVVLHDSPVHSFGIFGLPLTSYLFHRNEIF